MTTVRAEAAYQRAAAAFRNPTLDLLHGRYAPFVIATLTLVFTAERPTVPIADAHVEIGDIADELRAAGYDAPEPRVPRGNGREICRYWVRVGWLIPQIEEGVEAYRLSAQAVGALEIAGRAGGGRARVSRSRVRTLLDAVEQLSLDAETDAGRRRAALLAERDAIDARLAALRAGDSSPLDDEQLLEEAENVLHLARELPADFTRVAESINDMQRDVVAELRRDVRPAGEVLREYLDRGQHVMEATPEGRAFAGALALIGEPEHIDELTEQVHALLSLPFARLMDASQRAELNTIAKRVEQGVQEVLVAQRRASHVITAQVRTHDPARDREVDELLRGVMAGMQAWMKTSTSHERVEPLRTFPTSDLGHLRQSLAELDPPSGPAPLRRAEERPHFVDADTRAWGGPHYDELEAHVASLGPEFDLAAAFESAGAGTRRPVDLLGLLEIAHRNGMRETGDVAVVEAVRPDGSRRRFAFGGVSGRSTPPPAQHTTETNPAEEGA